VNPGNAATRVLRVFSRLNIGGPSRHVIHLSAGLVQHGFETRLVVGTPDPHEGDFHDLAEARGVNVSALPELGRAVRPLKDIRALLKLFRLMRRDRPDIVHTHTAKAGALGRTAALMARVPVVVHTYHGHVLSGYFNPLTSLFFRGVERALAPTSDVLLTVSESVREDLVRLRVAPADRVRVLPLGLDLEALKGPLPKGALRAEAGWGGDVRVVGAVGRLVPIKDLDTLIDVAALVAARADDVRFAVVGDGVERARLEARARSVLGERMHFFGWRKDTAAVFGDLDVVVNTSLNEGTPVALIEALAAGRPVIATAVGGTCDLLEGGRFGVLAPAKAAHLIARAIQSVLDSTDAARRIAAEGQVTVLQRYSVARLLDDMATLYRGLLPQDASRPGRRIGPAR
jgi:glycosyltransferase involved in cell wall biosynthesis